MSYCVDKISHSCGTSDGLQVFQEDSGEINGYCFSCATYIHPGDPALSDFGGVAVEKPPKRELTEDMLETIQSLPSVDVPSRKLKRWALEKYGVRVGVSEADGKTPNFLAAPLTREGKIIGYRCRLLDPKKFWVEGNIKDADLFGWEVAKQTGARDLFITEGYEDCVALYQALKDHQIGTKWEHLEPAVVSLKGGASGAKSEIARSLNKIRSLFKNVIFVFDQDEPGEKAAREALTILPHAKKATLPEHDANQCIMKGKGNAMCKAILFKAEAPKGTRIVCARDIWHTAAVPVEMGIPYPWEGLTRLTRGIRDGEVTYIGAGVKMGKSSLASSIAAHLVLNHEQNIMVAKPEEDLRYTMRILGGQAEGKIFHDPLKEFDKDAYLAAGEKMADRIYLMDLYQHLKWHELREDIIMCHEKMGTKYFFIDPITNLTTGMMSAEVNTHLQDIAVDLAALNKELGTHTFIFCHLKAPDSGQPHERGGKVLSYQFAGSRAMMRSAQVMLGLEGNKDEELPVEQRNMRKLVVLEDRMYGATGSIRLFYDENTGLMTEIQEN